MSCSARLPVYALFVGAFFVEYKAIVVLSLYVLGAVLALGLVKLFSVTILKGENSLFVIELPPYRMPQRKALWQSTWDKGKGFVRKAGTFIFAGSVLIWLFAYMGPGGLNVLLVVSNPHVQATACQRKKQTLSDQGCYQKAPFRKRGLYPFAMKLSLLKILHYLKRTTKLLFCNLNKAFCNFSSNRSVSTRSCFCS